MNTMVDTGATKLTLASLLTDGDAVPASVEAAARRLQAAADGVLARARASGAVRSSVRIDEVYLLIRGLAHAQATRAAKRGTVTRAIDLVIAGLSEPAGG